jgi:hypothetical protein
VADGATIDVTFRIAAPQMEQNTLRPFRRQQLGATHRGGQNQ